jgi:hypothetical protein
VSKKREIKSDLIELVNCFIIYAFDFNIEWKGIMGWTLYDTLNSFAVLSPQFIILDVDGSSSYASTFNICLCQT